MTNDDMRMTLRRGSRQANQIRMTQVRMTKRRRRRLRFDFRQSSFPPYSARGPALLGARAAHHAVAPLVSGGRAFLFFDQQLFLLSQFPVGFGHHSGQLFERDLWLPLQEALGLS